MGETAKQTLPAAEPAIFRAIAGVIADVGAVAKDKINKQQGFKFRSIDDVYNALHPALAKNKVFIVPRILEQTREVVGKTQKGTNMTLVICKIKFTFYAEDGSYIESVIIGEGLDTGDKATNKAMAIAYKYACFQVFCIPTEEMVDPDAERPEMEMEQTAGKKNGQTKASDKKKAEEPPKQNLPAGTETGQAEAKPTDPITPAMLQTIRAEQERTGVTDELILKRKQVKSKSIETMTIEEFKYIMSVFEITPDKKGNQNE
ncbi:MAG: ERF family protein [Clostridiales bacterium]|nr:ERF family protein [Clostridiales bacterium]